MSTGEDDSSPGLNGRLRPRKSTATTPSPQNKNIQKTEGNLAQDRPKRNSTPSKSTPAKQDDFASKSSSDPSSDPLILCPYCDRKFSSKQTATKHARRIHLPTTKQDTFIKCLYCNHSDAEAHSIIKHMVDNHPNQYFACLECYTRFLSTTELAQHKHNVCEKQKAPYRSRLRQKISTRAKNNPKTKSSADEKSDSPKENAQLTDNHGFNGIVISCELKPSDMHDATDVEDKITTNLILPPSKSLASSGIEKNAIIVLDELTWNKRIPPNFSFHNTDADQILSRLGVVHRSPRVGESRKDLIRMMDEPNEKFEKCFDTSFYTRVTKNVQENLAKYLDGSFNFDPNKDTTIKTRKSKTSVVINTAEGFPILLAYEQFSRNLFDGVLPRSLAPKHKWKWDSAESDKNLVMLLDQSKRDSHVNNCIITLVSSLDIWTQLRMRRKFEEIYKTTPALKKKEKQNLELKEILESRDIPTTSSQLVPISRKVLAGTGVRSEMPEYLGLSRTTGTCEAPPAVLSGEWVRPRCYVCCACGEQTRDGRALSSHITTHHPNAQVQHYEIVGETLLSADILKHLYVPPNQISNRTRPPRGFRDCTKCNTSVTLEDLHQHMLDCAGDTPTVRRKVRYRPFGVRRRRTRLPDTTIRKKIRKDIRSRRHRQKARMRPRVRTEVGDAESIRKMIADLPAKRKRTTSNILRPRRNIVKKTVRKLNSEAKSKKKRVLTKIKKDHKETKKDNDNYLDEDDQPLKVSAKLLSTRSNNVKEVAKPRRTRLNKTRKSTKKRTLQDKTKNTTFPKSDTPPDQKNSDVLGRYTEIPGTIWLDQLQSYLAPPSNIYPTGLSEFYNELALELLPPQIAQAFNYQLLKSEQSNGTLPQQSQQARNAIANPQYKNIVMQNVMHNNEMQNFAHWKATERSAQSSSSEQTNQRIDLRGEEMAYIRQRGNDDSYNAPSDNERPDSRRDDLNQNRDMARAANVPLKHSIASLTSFTGTQPRNTPSPFDNAASQSSDIDVVSYTECSDTQATIEDVVPEKFDKPPLTEQHDSTESHRAHRSVTENSDKRILQSGVEPIGTTSELGGQNEGGQPNAPKASLQFVTSEYAEEQRGYKVKSRKSINDISHTLMIKRLERPASKIDTGEVYTASKDFPRSHIEDSLTTVDRTCDSTKLVTSSTDTATAEGKIIEATQNPIAPLSITNPTTQRIKCRVMPIIKNRYSVPEPTTDNSVLMQNSSELHSSNHGSQSTLHLQDEPNFKLWTVQPTTVQPSTVQPLTVQPSITKLQDKPNSEATRSASSNRSYSQTMPNMEFDTQRKNDGREDEASSLSRSTRRKAKIPKSRQTPQKHLPLSDTQFLGSIHHVSYPPLQPTSVSGIIPTAPPRRDANQGVDIATNRNQYLSNRKTQDKMNKRSAETLRKHNEAYFETMRRHSLEMSNIYNYEMSNVYSHRDYRENDVNIPPSMREPSSNFRSTPDFNTRIHGSEYSNTSFVSPNRDTGGTMRINNPGCSKMHREMNYQQEIGVHSEERNKMNQHKKALSGNDFEARVDSTSGLYPEFSRIPCTDSFRHGARSSGGYHTRMSPYQRDVVNTSVRNIYDASAYSHNAFTGLGLYALTAPPPPPPPPPAPPLPPPPPLVHPDDVPLDLSCDSKVRNKDNVESNISSNIYEETPDERPMIVNFPENYQAPLQSQIHRDINQATNYVPTYFPLTTNIPQINLRNQAIDNFIREEDDAEEALKKKKRILTKRHSLNSTQFENTEQLETLHFNSNINSLNIVNASTGPFLDASTTNTQPSTEDESLLDLQKNQRVSASQSQIVSETVTTSEESSTVMSVSISHDVPDEANSLVHANPTLTEPEKANLLKLLVAPSTSVYPQPSQPTSSHFSPIPQMENSKDQTNNDQNINNKEPKESETYPLSVQVSCDTEINLESVTGPDNVTVQNNFVSPISFHSLLQKPASKLKSSNEQTASLRAVRIKTTRKSSSDEIYSQINNANITVDKHVNLEQVVNQEQNNFGNVINVENAHALNLELNDNINTGQSYNQRNAILADDNRKKTGVLHKINMMKTISETNETTATEVEAVAQFTDLHNTRQADYRVDKEITADPSACDENVNMEIVNFLGPVQTTFNSSGDKPLDISSQNRINEIQSPNELPVESLSTFDKYENVLTTHQDSENAAVEQSIDKIIIEKKTPSDQSETINVPCDENTATYLKRDSTVNLPTAQLLTKDNKSSDDSEDDVSLAVIKQKHCDNPKIMKASLRGKKPRFPPTLKNKTKKHVGKLVLKRQKKNKLVNQTFIEVSNQTKDTTNDDTPYDVINNIEYDRKDQSIKKLLPSTTMNNKDKHESNKINEDNISDEINYVEQNNQTRLLENAVTKKLEQDHERNNVNVIKHLDLTEKIRESALATSAKTQIDMSLISIKEPKLKLQNKTISLSLDQYSDNGNIKKTSEIIQNKTSIISIRNKINSDVNEAKDNMLDLEAKDAEPLQVSQVSTKEFERITISPTSNDKTESEFQMSSETRDKNAVPLRRSRRGKSMFVDSSLLIDDVVQDGGQKSHLTMKRLILSRVEKDRERNNEGITKDSDDTDRPNLTDTEVTDLHPSKKIARLKRKKSPPLKKKTKKAKLISEHKNKDETTDTNIKNNAPESNNAILRELPNAENKIEDQDIRVEGVKSLANSDNTTSICENSTLASKDDICELLGDSLSDSKEIIVPGKRKLNTSKTNDNVPNKSKKTKYHYEKKCNSDFDSDDDKGLFEAKQQKETEELLISSDSDSTNIKINAVLQKEDNSTINSDFINKEDTSKHIPSASTIIETRTTCYSRDNSNRPRSYRDSTEHKANYDPYDIDFEDMLETSKPVSKKRGKNTGISHTELKYKMKLKTKNVVQSLPKKNELPPLKTIHNDNKIESSNYHESDSDSSKSDVPLQKYVEEKAIENQLRSKTNNEINLVVNESRRAGINLKSAEPIHDNSIDMFNEDNDVTTNFNKVEDYQDSSKANTLAQGEEKYDNNLCGDDTAIMGEHLNTDTNVDLSSYTLNKETKDRQAQALDNDVLYPISEIDHQLKSDKFMENFGFYSERIPRKSNLLASKKISETFHMIGNDSDDSYIGCTDKTTKKSTQHEIKKKSDTCSDVSASQDPRSDNTTSIGNTAAIIADVEETSVSHDETLEEGEVDAVTAQLMLNSEDIKKMEYDLIYGINETPDLSAAPFFVNYRRANPLETTAPCPGPNISTSQIENSESITEVGPSETHKNKDDKTPVYKAKMYPDVEEFDMFEDKFDKIKRKRRSQAVAAKQLQTTMETSTRTKSRKQAEKKKPAKNSKQSQQSAQVPTKGALKGFDGIKISISTQDLNMPPSVSPPRQQKKKKKVANKRRRDTFVSESTCSESEEKLKSTTEKDIYEFKDNEDTELLELRPSTVMDRFRSINKLKKEKGKSEAETKLREKAKDKEKKAEAKDKEQVNEEKVKVKRREKYHDNVGKKAKKHSSRDGRRSSESGRKATVLEKDVDDKEKHTKNINSKKISEPAANKNVAEKANSCSSKYYEEEFCDGNEDNTYEEIDITLPGTSGFIPNRIDESDYDSDVTSPEGEFIFYTSEDLNCVCPSDNDFEDSDGERSCSRPNCIYKNRNADKNTAIGNIFKNNAVRCEKPEIKVPEQPKPDLDQLFDSLFETKPNDNDESGDQNDVSTQRSDQFLVPMHAITLGRDENTRKTKSPVSQQDLDVLSKTRDLRETSKKESVPVVNETKTTSKRCRNEKKSDDMFATKYDDPYSLNEFLSEPEINSDDHEKSIDIAISPLLDDHFADQDEEIFDTLEDAVTHDVTMDINHTPDQTISELDYERTSEDMLPDINQLRCAQDPVLSNDSDAKAGSQSVAIPEGDNLESYTTMEENTEHSALIQDELNSPERDQGIDIPGTSKNDSRLEGVEASHNSKSTKSEKKKRRKSCKRKAESDKGATSKLKEKTGKEARSRKNKNVSSETPVEFAAPASPPAVEEQSPTRADVEVDEAAAPQRARRKCTVGKQNVLAEHWSSESEVDGRPPRPNSADSVVASSRKKKKKKDGQNAASKKSRNVSKGEPKARRRGASADRAGEAVAGRPRGPSGPKIRARPAQCWTSDGEDGNGPQPLHGWIVGNSHKKLVTLLAHKKGGKCANPE